jgi:hypothetical protein
MMYVFVIIFYAINNKKKTGRPDITEIILKVASITITLTPIAYVIKISRIFAE